MRRIVREEEKESSTRQAPDVDHESSLTSWKCEKIKKKKNCQKKELPTRQVPMLTLILSLNK